MKITEYILGGAWLLVLLSNLGIFAQNMQKEYPRIKPGKIYKQTGATVASPNQIQWQIVKADKLETVFLKTTAEGKLNAFARTMKIDVHENVKDLFDSLESLKKSEIRELNMDSLHFNNTEFKETPCLQYDGIFRNPVPNYEYFNMSGYICRHPDDKNVAVQFEFSNYSNTRGYTAVENKLSKSFFEKIKFAKITSK